MAASVCPAARTTLPALRLIGRTGTRWADWWAGGWFDALEHHTVPPYDPDYLDCIRACDGQEEAWIGMLFPADAPVPEGYRAIGLPAGDYALILLRGREDDPGLYGSSARALCLQAMEALGMTPAPGLTLVRYNCPRFTTPDAEGCVIVDYLLPLKGVEQHASG
ncbi:MAG: hypothetical protein ACI4O7_15145 [Aristaeellaceae bacterium]